MAAKAKHAYAPHKALTKAQKAKAAQSAIRARAGKVEQAEARAIAGYTRRAALQSKSVNRLAARSFGKRLSAVQSRSVVIAHIRMATQQAASRAAEQATIAKYAVKLSNTLAGKTVKHGKLSKAALAKRRATLAKNKAAKAKAGKTPPAAKPAAHQSKTSAVHGTRGTSKAAQSQHGKSAKAKASHRVKHAGHKAAKSRGAAFTLPRVRRWAGWPSGEVAREPWCCAAAVADALLMLTGRRMTRREIGLLHHHALLRHHRGFQDSAPTIPETLTAAVSLGLITSWFVLAGDEQSDEIPATIAGIETDDGDHAVAVRGDGWCVLWGELTEISEIDEQYIVGVLPVNADILWISRHAAVLRGKAREATPAVAELLRDAAVRLELAVRELSTH